MEEPGDVDAVHQSMVGQQRHRQQSPALLSVPAAPGDAGIAVRRRWGWLGQGRVGQPRDTGDKEQALPVLSVLQGGRRLHPLLHQPQVGRIRNPLKRPPAHGSPEAPRTVPPQS